jgi:hypothetical protein
MIYIITINKEHNVNDTLKALVRGKVRFRLMISESWCSKNITRVVPLVTPLVFYT